MFFALFMLLCYNEHEILERREMMRIKEIRLQRGYTQNDLAKMLRISFSTLSKYENGKLEVPIKRLQDIARYLGVEVTDLLELTPVAESSFDETPDESNLSNIIPLELSLSETVKQNIDNRVLAGMVLNQANGVCELCGHLGPFLDRNGRPYLEAHRLVPIQRCVKSDVESFVALCPNCHRKMHYLNLPEDVKRLKSLAKKHRTEP